MRPIQLSTLLPSVLMTTSLFISVQLEFTSSAASPSLCTDKDFVGVSKPWEFRFGSDIRRTDNRIYMMVGQIACCGYIGGWEFQASLRAQVRPIHFLVWRPLQASSLTFTLIGQHVFWYMKERSQTVTIKLAEEDYVLVRHGDMIGWQTPLGDVIDYKTTTNDRSSTYLVTHSVLNMTVGMNYTLNGLHDSGRIYGIKAVFSSVQPPRFVNPPLKITSKCPLEANDYITTIEVFDKSLVKYNIDGFNPWLTVDETTGEVRTIAPINGNLTINISIVVTSTCDVRASVVVSFQCIDLDVGLEEKQADDEVLQKSSDPISQAPTMVGKSVYHLTFRESLTSETIIRVFNTTGASRSEKVICTLTGTQPNFPGSILYISGNTLLVKSHYNLLYNSTPTVCANVTCIHGDVHAVEELNIIHVIKDLEPSFDNLPAMTNVSALKTRVGDTVFQVAATDMESQTLTFDSVNCSCPFSVNIDGSVTVISDLRMVTQPSFVIAVIVSDGFHSAGPGFLSIVIKEKNRPPHFINLHNEVVVPENTQGTLMTIQSHDPDIHDTVTITWAWGDVSAHRYFIFNPDTEQLCVNGATKLDYELLMATINLTSFSLFVSVNDGALFSNTEQIVVFVTDVNEGPSFSLRNMTVTCSEGKAGLVLLDSQIRALAADPDINDILVFHLLPGHWSHMFSINRKTGQLTYDVDYDSDPSRQPSYVTLHIQVSDSGNLIDVLELNLFIQNVNRAPVVDAPDSVSVSEDTPGGTFLFAVSASDWDTDDKLKISIICTDHSTNHFIILQSGVVRLKENASLNYEETSLFRFQVHAEDGFTTSPDVFVVLQVTDVNEQPISNRDKLLITALQRKSGDCISKVDLRDIFTDPDLDTLTFSLLQVNGTDWTTFIIDAHLGWLHLSHDVYVTRDISPLVFVVEIMAQDPEKLSAKIETEVAFHFINTKPILPGLPAHVTVLESKPLGEVVYTVSFTDKDGDIVTLRYHFEDDMQHILVSVNISNGEVRLMTCPKLSQGQNIHTSIAITAFDGQDVSEPGLINITVIGVNNPPRFPREEYRFIINETQVGTYIESKETWTNLDLDPGDILTFYIAGGNDEGSTFVNTQTGEIGVVNGYDIDMEGSSSSLTCLLMVMDSYGLNSTTKVIINIIDINDNAPIVKNDGEIFVISSDAVSGYRIGQIQASDFDSGKNGELTFNFFGSSLNDTTGYFINARDGWIILAETIGGETNHITLYVAISDCGWPANTATAVVHIIVNDSSNGSFLQSSLLQHSASTDESRSYVVYILIGLVTCSIVIIAVLSYQLWKAHKVHRTTQPEQDHNAYHEYRFPWIPRQIVEEGQETDTRNSRSSLNALPSFLETSVSNQNFQYQPAVLSPSQESQEPCSSNQTTHVQTNEIDKKCEKQDIEE